MDSTTTNGVIRSPALFGRLAQPPNIDNSKARREYIWEAVRLSDATLTDQQLLNIHGHATIEACQWAASLGWVTITEDVLQWLIELNIWKGKLPMVPLPWHGDAYTGNWQTDGASQFYSNWLQTNHNSVFAPRHERPSFIRNAWNYQLSAFLGRW
jgi:hypothetical protein